VSYLEKSFYTIGTLRAILVIKMAIINLILAKNNKSNISAVLTVFLPPLIFILLPTMIGYVAEENFIYYPFILIAFSILPHLLLLPEEVKLIYWPSLLYYSFLVVFSDVFLRFFSPTNYIIIERIDTFYIYYKTSHILIFLFINYSVFYMRRLNRDYENKLFNANIYLVNQSNVLSNKNKVLENNRKELERKNSKLEKLRSELKAQNLELEETLLELKEAQSKLIRSEKLASLGVLTAGVAHEINNPLNYIAGGITILEIEMIDLFKKINEVDETIDLSTFEFNIENSFIMIKEGVERVVSIIESLRTYTTGAKSLQKISDINSILKSTLKYIEPKLDKDIQVILDLKLIKSVPVVAEKIHQVFLNILDNGVFALQKSNNLKKELKISTDSDGKYARIYITNNGPTIAENQVLKIFDPFFTTKEPNEGTGLGMSISYNFIKEHGGDIELINEESNIGFLILLPFE
jgi:C4-dicarboxylate-specific signal transduction histidine kinase